MGTSVLKWLMSEIDQGLDGGLSEQEVEKHETK
jgi:hypothetical protein